MERTKINAAQRHILTLAERDAGTDGWATCSAIIWDKAVPNVPVELLDREPLDTGGRVRVTQAGRVVLRYV